MLIHFTGVGHGFLKAVITALYTQNNALLLYWHDQTL